MKNPAIFGSEENQIFIKKYIGLYIWTIMDG